MAARPALMAHADGEGGALTAKTALSEPCARFAAYWRDLAPGPDRLPARAQVDPAAIVDLLPGVWLLETMAADGRTRTPEGPRFRCRLYGSGLVDAFGRDLTGRLLDEVDPGFETSDAARDFRAVVEERTARWWRGPVAMQTPRQADGVEVVMAPLAADGVHVDMILCFAQPLFGDPPRPLGA